MASLWMYAIAIFIGIAIGYALPVFRHSLKVSAWLSEISLWIILLSMGTNLGLNQNFIRNLPLIAFQALLMALSVIIASITFVLLAQKVFGKKLIANRYMVKKNDIPKQANHVFFSIMLIGMLALGVLLANYFMKVQDKEGLIVIRTNLEKIADRMLLLLIAASGFSLGQKKDLFRVVRQSGWGIIIMPLAVLIGSLIAAAVLGKLFGLKLPESFCIGGACGWYTFAGIQFAFDARLSELAFLSNLFRELIAILIVPFIAKKIGSLASIAPAGVTAMDTSLPSIVRSTGSEYAIIAFASGAILTLIVPILYSILIPFIA